MSSSYRSPMEDPLTIFLTSAEAEDLSNRAKLAAVSVSQKHAQTMSRIGAPASDLFAENLSFGDPLSRTSASIFSPAKVESKAAPVENQNQNQNQKQNTFQSRQHMSANNLHDDRNSRTPVPVRTQQISQGRRHCADYI